MTVNPSDELIVTPNTNGILKLNNSDPNDDIMLWKNYTWSDNGIILSDSSYNVYAVFTNQKSIIKIKS
jgi:hypothetical protein